MRGSHVLRFVLIAPYKYITSANRFLASSQPPVCFSCILRMHTNILNCFESHNCDLMTDTDEQIFRRAQGRVFRGFEKEANLEWRGPFRFIQAADSQFGLIDEMRYVKWSEGDSVAKAIEDSAAYKRRPDRGPHTWRDEVALVERAIHQWNHMNPAPRFVVICGDLVNDFPGESQRDAQIADFKKVFRKLDRKIPLVLLPGNHDLKLEGRNSERAVRTYVHHFGDDYFSFWIDGVMFIVINVQYFKDLNDARHLAALQEAWIDERLAEVTANKHRYKHVIVFQHIPWFLRDIDEPDDEIFNITIAERKRMLNKFDAAGIRAIFAGHYHRNAGGKYQNLELVVTSALGAQIAGGEGGQQSDKSGYRVVQVDEHHIQHHYVPIET